MVTLFDYLDLCAEEEVEVYDSDYDISCTVHRHRDMYRLVKCFDRICEVTKIVEGKPFIDLYANLNCDEGPFAEAICRYFPDNFDQEDFLDLDEDGYGQFITMLFDAITLDDADDIATYADLFDEAIDCGYLL